MDKKTSTERAKTRRCDICLRDSFTESILSCHRCITVQHTFCLPSPLVSLPDRKWLCPACSDSSLRPYPSRRRRHSDRCSAGVGEGGGGAGVAGGGTGGRGTNGESSSSLHSGSPQANGVITVATKLKGGRTTTTAKHPHLDAGANGTAPAGPAASSIPTNKRSRRAASSNGAPAPVTMDDKEAATAAAAAGGKNAPTPPHPTTGTSSSDTEREPFDPGSTITLFCRRDFRRYLRWKRRELANQDKERRREEQTKARKTFSSIIASNGRR